jgi:hypothetical protein
MLVWLPGSAGAPGKAGAGCGAASVCFEPPQLASREIAATSGMQCKSFI